MELIQTIQQVRNAIESVTLKNPPFPMSLSVSSGSGMTYFGVHTLVKDRDTGGPIELNFMFDIKLPVSQEIFYEFVESRVRAVFLHEFEECFHIDGVRIRNPHPDDRDSLFKADFDTPLSSERAMHGSNS